MKTVVNSQQTREVTEIKTMLQIRVLHQDEKGTMHDVTHDQERIGYGLKGLRERSAQAHAGLLRTNELLRLLALAAENREHVDSALVRRVLGEVETELSHIGDLGSYICYTEELFEGAMALPRISGIKRQYA